MPITSNYKSASSEFSKGLVEKSYLLDRYPELASTYRFAGLWLWGNNNKGQLGTNDITHRSSPVQTVAGGTNWKSIASLCASFLEMSVIKDDGTLWLWGRNTYGQLGVNDITHRSSPVQTVAGGTNWKQSSDGYAHTAAIKTDGTLWTWGQNNKGQLGDSTITHKSSPVQTTAGGTNWKLIACGDYVNAAIKTDGTLWTWGQGQHGQLGNNSVDDKSSPIQTVSGGTNWKLAIGGVRHCYAIKTDGTLWGWGRNAHGHLGVNDIVHRSSPVQTIAGGTNWKLVISGQYIVTAIKNDGTLWTWGNNGQGQLGTNDIAHRSSPVQTVAGGTNWKSVGQSSGIKTDGTLWLWGLNTDGQLGVNDITHRSSPIQTVSGGTNWKSVICSAAPTNQWTAAIRDNSNDDL